ALVIGKWILDTQIFFAHPYSSWEKGAIENMNKLIRPATKLLFLTEQSMFMEKIAVYQLQTSDPYKHATPSGSLAAVS
ncbi:MAG: hypothetical protein M0P35_10455, partial [Bacteroidales bacterium]|nr:hypothetical protein [Bacteroidales bacterium]